MNQQTTTQQRMRALLDQRAQQAKQSEQSSNKTSNSNQVLRRWTGPKRSGSMRGRRSGA